MQYSANKRITDGNYDKSLAVKCVNGTFVGRRMDDVIVYRGIPFVGRQPVGEYRWKAPVDIVPDDGVYEAYYSGKSPFQHKDFSAEATLANQSFITSLIVPVSATTVCSFTVCTDAIK